MKPLPKLFEIVVKRTAITWDEPHKRATDLEGVLAVVQEAMALPFKTIEIVDVSHWNHPSATSVTLTEDCPRLENSWTRTSKSKLG